MRPHVLHILPYLETGGTERHVLTLITSLEQLGLCSGEVLAPEGPFSGQLADAGIDWTSFTSAQKGVVRSFASFRRAFEVRLKRASLVHVHAAPDLLLLVAVSRARRVARVLTVHGFHGRGGPISYRFAARLGSRLGDAIISVSGSEERLLLAAGAHPDKLHRVYNGVADVAENDF